MSSLTHETQQAETSALIAENTRAQERAKSQRNLDVARADYDRATRMASIEADAAANLLKWERERQVEALRVLQQTEALRADNFAAADVEADVAVRRAEGEARAIKLKAEAELYAQQQHAAGLLALRTAEAEGLQRLADAAGGTDLLNKVSACLRFEAFPLLFRCNSSRACVCCARAVQSCRQTAGSCRTSSQRTARNAAKRLDLANWSVRVDVGHRIGTDQCCW